MVYNPTDYRPQPWHFISTALTTPEKTKKTKKQKGQPKKLTDKAMTRVLRLLETLQRRADGRVEVTATMAVICNGASVDG